MNTELVGLIWHKSGILHPQWVGIINHMVGVAAVATHLSGLINKKNPGLIDITLVENAALVHDVGKTVLDTPTGHVTHGAKMLRRFGVDERIIRIVTRHQWWSFQNRRPPETWEEKIVFLSDFIFGGSIESLEDRRESIFSRYLAGQEKKKERVNQELEKIKSEIEKIIETQFPY